MKRFFSVTLLLFSLNSFASELLLLGELTGVGKGIAIERVESFILPTNELISSKDVTIILKNNLSNNVDSIDAINVDGNLIKSNEILGIVIQN